MRSILVLLTFFVVIYAVTKEQKEAALKKYNEECTDETGIPEEEVQKMRDGDYSNNSEITQDYIFCMFRKMDVMSEDGVFDKEKAMSKLSDDDDKEAAERAMDACMDEKGSRPQENAFLMAKCYSQENPGHSFLY